MLHLLIYSTIRNERIIVNSDDDTLCNSIIDKLWKSTDVDTYMGGSCVRIRIGDKTKEAIQWIVDKYEKDYPSLNKLLTPIKKLKNEQGFYIINEDKDKDNNIVFRKIAIDCLEFEKQGGNWRHIHNSVFKHYSLLNIIFKFHSYGFDGIKYYAGEQDKNKRRCRFCGKTGAGNFHDIAHAIQDSLGNDLLICNEECDECNHKLNRIEDNFLHVMDIRRSIMRIGRKKTTKSAKVIGYNFVIEPNDNGDAEVYLMNEKLPPKDQRDKPFSYTLKTKADITNEGVYQALVKMVIDLMPSNEVRHFEQTIDWINSLGNMYPGPLPSMYIAISPSYEHRQPSLDIMIRKEDTGNTPYCTAILWIYDLAYMFVVPLVDVDRARFKTDASLEKHWQLLKSYFPFQWMKQDTSEWTNAYPWVIMNIDLTDPIFHVLPKDAPMFNESNRIAKSLPEQDFPVFDNHGISTPIVTTKFRDLHNNVKISIDDLREVTEHPRKFYLSLDKRKKDIRFVLNVLVNDASDKKSFFEYSIDALFHLDCFDKYVKIGQNKTSSIFAFDWHLRDFLVKSAFLFAECQMVIKRKGTPFENCTLNTLLKAESLKRMLDHLVYIICFNGKKYQVIDTSIHGRDYINP